MAGLYDVFLGCASRLSHAASSAFGDPARARNGAPARFVWVPRSDAFEAANGHGRGARQFHDRVAHVEVHVTGRTYGEAEALRAGLVTALRDQLGGPAYALGAARWSPVQELDGSWLCEQPIAIRLPLYRADLPAAGATPQAPPADAYTTATPTSAPLTADLVDP